MGGGIWGAPMRLIKAVYLFSEEHFFYTLPRKILGCLVPPFVMLSILSWQSLRFTAQLRTGLGSSATPEHLAALERAEWMAKLFPWIALILAAFTFITFFLSMSGPLKQITKIIEEGDFSKDIHLETSDEVRRLADG